ncbi:hypothetical protein ACWN6Y_06060 [Vagococcus teuberi]|uniref:Uncharacterized protein n=1 Tax=Vagococcus teuberi TaxID=519472 RepID=A0A1J0A5A5_9ENTE|nr:hypothetical protein BHY08_04285 [Vagococcus teuberi]
MSNHTQKILRITDNHLDLTSTEEANINGRKPLINKRTYSPMPLAYNHNWTAQCSIVGKM